MADISVESLRYFPIKSCGAVEAQSVTFTELGVQYDREWMLVGRKGQFLSQRTFPELALVETAMDMNNLYTAAPEIGRLAISLQHDPDDTPEVAIDLFKKPGTGYDAGEDAAAYFSDYLKTSARLLRIAQPRSIRPDCQVEGASSTTGFADGFQILLASTSSLAELNGQLTDQVTIDRFRPNIVVEGTPAYDEDYWREIKIGSLQAFIVRACARCPMPNIDQNVGILPKQRSVTEALRHYRSGIDPTNDSRGEFFGQNVTHVFEPGIQVSVGDGIEIVRRTNGRNFIRVD